MLHYLPDRSVKKVAVVYIKAPTCSILPAAPPFNMTTTPSATVPVGFTKAGLPVGLQISGGHLADAEVITASAAFEDAHPWATTSNLSGMSSRVEQHS